MWVEHHLPALTLPFRVMHGLADRVTSPEGSKLLLEKASSTDKEIELYEGVRTSVSSLFLQQGRPLMVVGR